MENKEYTTRDRRREREYRIGRRSKNNQVLIGAFIIAVGVLILFRRMGLPVPHWLLSWEMMLITIGVVMGVRSGFRDISWIIPIIIGTIFISKDIFPGFHLGNLVWPVGVIVIGVIFVLKGNKRHAVNNWFGPNDPNPGGLPPKDDFVSGFKRVDQPLEGSAATFSSEPELTSEPGKFSADYYNNDMLDCTAVFGGVKRTVVSKNFKGGEIVAVFGGADIDLTHADINGIVKLEATNVFGGTKLIVPPTWDVQSEMVAVFGGVEDKRRIQPEMINRNKRLILYGTAFLGGLEIKSF